MLLMLRTSTYAVPGALLKEEDKEVKEVKETVEALLDIVVKLGPFGIFVKLDSSLAVVVKRTNLIKVVVRDMLLLIS
jgi:Na+/serine symporter